MTQKLIIDCDPGQDDAINLFLALPPTNDYDILGITVVAGNVGLDKVQRNARLLCELAGRTNIPIIIPKIKDIVLMGGALREGGNITPSAEFNIYVDPHAAQIVFESGCKTVVFGLDVTHQVLSSNTVLDRIKNIGNPVAMAAYNLLTHYGRFDAEKYGSNGAPLHDPCTMAYILKPELFTFKACNIRVEAESELTRGHTSVDFWYATELPRSSLWAYKVDSEGFFDLLISQLSKYS